MFPIDQLQGTYSWYKFTFVCMIILIPFVVLAASEGGRKVFVACLASCICLIAAPIVFLAEIWDRVVKITPCSKKYRERQNSDENNGESNSTARKIMSREASILIDADGEAVPLWEKNWADTDATISRMLLPIKHHKNCPEREKMRTISAPPLNPFATPQPGFGRKLFYATANGTLDSLSEMDSMDNYFKLNGDDVYSIPEDVFEGIDETPSVTPKLPPKTSCNKHSLGKL